MSYLVWEGAKPVKHAEDLFGNDITDEENRRVLDRRKKQKQKERARQRRENRKVAKKKENDRKNVLKGILTHSGDLFGGEYTETERQQARKELASLESNGRKKVEKIVREAVRDALKSFL